MYDNEDAYLESKEENRLASDAEQVALAERTEPEKIVELRASFTESQLLDVVAERAMERLFGRYGNESLEHDIRKHIHALASQAAKEVLVARVDEQVGEAVAKVLSEGFQPTNSYGEPSGPRKTVASFVLEYLSSKPDSYGRGDERWHKKADELVNTYLQKELAPHLEKLKKRCMDALDNSVAGKIREAVISGLGLKV